MITDALINELVDEQSNLFFTDAPLEQKEDVLRRIVERQKELKKLNKD